MLSGLGNCKGEVKLKLPGTCVGNLGLGLFGEAEFGSAPLGAVLWERATAAERNEVAAAKRTIVANQRIFGVIGNFLLVDISRFDFADGGGCKLGKMNRLHFCNLPNEW